MPEHLNKKIISLIGPPGSGKGTQADLLAQEFGLFHFDTSRVLRKSMATAKPGDSELEKQKELYKKGELLSPPFVARVVLKEVRSLMPKHNGIVFSGSPRTVYEVEAEASVFEELVGYDNVFFFYIALDKEESVKRNSHRLVCEKSRHSIPNLPQYKEARDLGVCPEDGSRLVRRSLDSPDMIAKRFDIFLRDTRPVIDKINGMGYKLIEVNGEQPINKVFEDIKQRL